ncbi:Mrp family chromosome partitioning ATPase [Keratinibaculum paraultunense]|uniref:Iron-sulfur cluster carrier protein n=1 Tax=Keratinibaculum paraultunense TaxID=1278232 RepID=A0A4R3KU25_9FIRM|nr:Mrp/NBP35 family ATP-binding protein [Keratinibaculum paraultunense]QQY79860.1 Mrp/NBP35 family ATP-binding protein [Keratinibaculum paraultunense]TCS88745.1 Mrp family chromosome partitioning ATPase [Keratinibaculum paraultunense]
MIDCIIGVMSGKGGVGKSTVSAMIAEELNKKGFKVGIMDADITGPSIPRLLNISHKKATANELGIIPVTTSNGIKVMSLNLLMEHEDQPVIWRGPLIAGVVEQFWADVQWGDLDYLIIDMPPGTGDVALTVMQSIPISGLVMVSVPQDLVSMIVSKSINMAKKLNIPILGVVENMSYVKCPDCGNKIRIFESESTIEFLKDNNLKLLGELPMSKDIANISIEGNDMIEEEIKSIFEQIATNIIEVLS